MSAPLKWTETGLVVVSSVVLSVAILFAAQVRPAAVSSAAPGESGETVGLASASGPTPSAAPGGAIPQAPGTNPASARVGEPAPPLSPPEPAPTGTDAARAAPPSATTPQAPGTAGGQSGAAQAPQTRPPGTGAPSAQARVLERGRALTRLFYDGPLEQVWAAFGPTVRAQWQGLADFRAYRASGREAYGDETGVVKEEVVQDGAVTYYLRTATFERGPRPGWTLVLGLDAGGRVQDFGIVAPGLLPGRQSGARP